MINIPQGNLDTNMEHNFSTVPQADINRSSFKTPFKHKTTFEVGNLVPIYVDEVLPGDTFDVDMESFARLSAPLTTPLMDNLYLDTHFFYVPNRLLWSNWEKFCGAQDDPGDSTDFSVPVITCPTGGWVHGSLADYFGIQVGAEDLDVAALHFRAYNLIYNEWYRDENLQNSVTVDLDNGPDTDTDYVVRKRNKRHDYFTSCLPWPH
jgi:hypothetical protein